MRFLILLSFNVGLFRFLSSSGKNSQKPISVEVKLAKSYKVESLMDSLKNAKIESTRRILFILKAFN